MSGAFAYAFDYAARVRRAAGPPPITGFIGVTSANAASATSATIAVPAGAQAGDFLLAFGVSNSTHEYTTPAGWLDRLTSVGFAMRTLEFYDGTTPSYTFATATGTAQPQAITLMAFRGYGWGAATALSGNAVEPTPAALSVPAANSIVMQIAAALAAGHTYSMPAGWTSRAAVSANRSLEVYQRAALAASGSLASTTMTRPPSSTGNSRALALSLSPRP